MRVSNRQRIKRRPAVRPWTGLFELKRQGEEQRVVAGASRELAPDGEARFVPVERDGHGGGPGGVVDGCVGSEGVGAFDEDFRRQVRREVAEL